MATYTEHYNLKKPQVNEQYNIADFNGNVDILDEALYEATQGGRNTFGVFIDTSKIIVSTTTFRTDTSYTATEDCAVVVGVPTSANAESVIKINNVKVGAIYSQSGISATYDTFFVKKGQTIAVEPSYTQGDSSYTVYGLTYGTQNVFAPQIYSFSERQVGVWTDGKPLYQKTYEFTITSTGNNIVLDSTLTSDRIQLIDSVVSYKRSADGNYLSPMLASVVTRLFCNSNGIEIERNGYDSWMGTVTGVVTVKYTKVADTAGSGEWTSQGVPAVHYSTDEHVVGTWIDGKTLYQKTIVTNAQVALSDNSWTAVPFASGDVPSDADTMFCTEWFNPIDSHLICDNRTRFIYDNGAIKGATSQTGGQTVPAGLTLTIRYTKAS